MKKKYILLLCMWSIIPLIYPSFKINETDILSSLSQKETELIEAYPYELFVRFPVAVRNVIELIPTLYPSHDYSQYFIDLHKAAHEKCTIIFYNLAVNGITNALEIVEKNKTRSSARVQTLLKKYLEDIEQEISLIDPYDHGTRVPNGLFYNLTGLPQVAESSL